MMTKYVLIVNVWELSNVYNMYRVEIINQDQKHTF